MRTDQLYCRLLPPLLVVVLAGCNASDADGVGTGGASAASGGSGLGGSGGIAASAAGTGVASGGSPSGGSSTAGAGVVAGSAGNVGGGGAMPAGGSGGGAGSNTAGLGATGGGGMTSTGGLGGDDGGAAGGGGTGGAAGGRGGASSTGGSAGAFMGTCTESAAAGRSATGSGPHDVVVETNSDPGIKEGTIFRPADLGGDEKYPIFVWGEGGCSQDGLSNATAMAEIASHGYFVIADGTPNGSGGRGMDRSMLDAMGAPLLAYIDWAIAENEKPCSAYYGSLDTTMIGSNGFSCGGLMAQGTVKDPRIVTWGVTSSGMAGAGQDFYDMVHTPVLFVEGGTGDVAYDGGLEGYQAIAELDVPVIWLSKDLGHGGDLFQADGGDFTRINLAWLNWWLKGDETATGKGLLVGASCSYCSDAAWDVTSAHIP